MEEALTEGRKTILMIFLGLFQLFDNFSGQLSFSSFNVDYIMLIYTTIFYNDLLD